MSDDLFAVYAYPPHGDAARGFLVAMEAPFPVKRAFFIHDWPAGVKRGGHAHRECQQLFVVVKGRVDFTLRNAHGAMTQTMEIPHQGLWVPPMVWVEMETLNLDNVLLCLCSTEYDEGDYLRDYDEWQRLVKESNA